MTHGTISAPGAHVVLERDGSVVVLEVGGELDMASVPQLRRQLAEVLESGATRVVIDLTRVSFIDSTSVAALVKAARRLRAGGRFAIAVEPGSYATLIFQAAGMDAVLPLFDTQREALAHARA